MIRADVGNQQIRRLLAQDAPGLRKVAGGDDAVPGVSEHFRQSQPGHTMIIDDEDGGHSGTASARKCVRCMQCMTETPANKGPFSHT